MGFVFLPLDTLIYRFGELADENGISSDTRLELWKETQDVIRAYPALGCGLGGYQSAFEKHQRVALLNLMDYAHNDYLQFLAETGWFGFAVMMAFIAGVAVKASRALQPERSLAERHLGMALIGAMSAIAAHSLADFNLYIPANAMTLVWMGGMAAGLTPRLG